jgi:long-chain acyl-CoA synthetase
MNIYPREVEEVLLEHPAVSAVAVIGRPDPEWGESIVAFIVANRDADVPKIETLDQLCIERIARYKRPKEYRFVESLPVNNYGKVLKRELRDVLKLESPEIH